MPPAQGPPAPRRDPVPPRPELPPRSLEVLLAVGLCLTVALGSAGLVSTDRAIARALRGVSAGASTPGERARPPLRATPQLVCLISIGGLRADRLGPKDGSAGTSALGSLAAQSVSFRWAGAQATRPLGSLKTLLTGKYPSSLILEQTGADLETLVASPNQRETLLEVLERARGTLAEGLGSRGYRSAAFTCGSTTTGEHGFVAGFERFEPIAGGLGAAAARALEWLGRPEPRPAFVFLETQELDLPADEESYAREARRLDRELGAFLDGLRELGLFDAALIAVTSDHGAPRGERAGAAGGLFLEELRVPLVLKFPAAWNVPAREEDAPVELIDLHPTLLEACGARARADADGASLLPLVLRGARGRTVLVAQTGLVPGAESATLRTIVAPEAWQVIHDARTGEMRIYDLARDPAALAPLTPGDPAVPAAVREMLGERSADPHEVAPGGSSAASVR